MTTYMGRTSFKKATIALAAAITGAIDVLGMDVVAIEQAASTEGVRFAFQGSVDGVNFADVYGSDGARLAITKSDTAAGVYVLSAAIVAALRGFVSIKIETTDAAFAAANQAGTAQTLKVGLAEPADR